MIKVKYHLDDSIERYKGLLFTQGFLQMHRIDYIEIFASTIRRELLRIFLAIVTLLGMIILQIDVIDAYFENTLRQSNYPIYMKILQGCKIGRKKLVCKILKSLYR